MQTFAKVEDNVISAQQQPEQLGQREEWWEIYRDKAEEDALRELSQELQSQGFSGYAIRVMQVARALIQDSEFFKEHPVDARWLREEFEQQQQQQQQALPATARWEAKLLSAESTVHESIRRLLQGNLRH